MLSHPRFLLWSLSCCVGECNASEDRVIISLVCLLQLSSRGNGFHDESRPRVGAKLFAVLFDHFR